MTSLILPHRRLLQPNGPVEIDWSHPLAQGLVFFVIPNDKATRELVGGASPTILSATALGVGRDGVGLSTANTTTEGWGINYRQDVFRTIGTEVTIATQVDIRALGANGKLVCAPLYSNTWTQPYQAISLSRNGTSAQVGIYIGTAAGAVAQNATFPVGTLSVGNDRRYIVSRSADTAWMTFNGTRYTPSSRTLTANPIAWNTGGHVALMTRSQGIVGEGTTGTQFYTAFWNRALSYEEQLDFQNAPYQILKPVPARRFYIAPSAPALRPVAASATGKLSALTGSASAGTAAPARAASATGTLPKLKAAAATAIAAPARTASMAAKLPGLRGQASAAQTAPRIAAEASGTIPALKGSATTQTTAPVRTAEASGRLSALAGSASAEVSTASIRAAAAGRLKSLSGSASAARDVPTITAEARGRIRPLSGTAPAIVFTVSVGASASARLPKLKGAASAAWEIPSRTAQVSARLKPLSGRAGAWRDVPQTGASAAAKLPALKGRATASTAVPEIRVNTSGRFLRLTGSATAGVGVIIYDAAASARLPKLKGRISAHMIPADAAHVLETVYLTGFVDFDVDLVGMVETDIAISGTVETDVYLTGTIET